MQIIDASGDPWLPEIRALFQEYWNSFGFTPCFQGFEQEVTNLPGAYAPPSGRLLIALVDGSAGGCVALRRLDDVRCEAKRLYVRPQFRSEGIGRALMSAIVREAAAAGYRELLGHTLPIMDHALALYDRLGFDRTTPGADNPAPDAIHIRLDLLHAASVAK